MGWRGEFLWVLLLLSSAAVDAQVHPVVETDAGLVRGSTVDGVSAFLSIPFAEPPEGDLRWRAPQPPQPWSGELQATNWPAPCPQEDDDHGAIGDEDCLYLNIWSPEDALPGSLPVMFFIHGGGNVEGSTSVVEVGTRLYEGDILAERGNVVVVTTQYRIGALGYLVHPALNSESPRGVSGNYGLLDQQAALQWLQTNIAAFGGDPSRVLLFGESAGATNTMMQLVSPLAAGLFSRALMESGGATARPARQRALEGLRFAEAVDCPSPSSAAICLRDRTPEELVTAVDTIGFGETITHGIVTTQFGPTVDGWVLPEDPEEAIEGGRFNHVAFVVGANSDEMRVHVPELGQLGYEALVRIVMAPWGQQAADRALELYPVGPGGYATGTDAYAALVSDPQFVCPTRRFASAASNGQTEPVYRFLFSHGLHGLIFSPLGAFHGLELFFVFQRLEDMTYYFPRADDLELQSRILELWTSFARDGVPATPGGPSWPIYNAENDPFMNLNSPLTTDEGLRTEKCDFWDTLLGQETVSPRRSVGRSAP